MYEDRPDFFALLPIPSNLTPAKFGKKALWMTNTHNTTRKFRRDFKAHMCDMCIGTGVAEEDISTCGFDC